MSKNYIVIISSLFLFVFIYYIKLMPSQNKLCHCRSTGLLMPYLHVPMTTGTMIQQKL